MSDDKKSVTDIETLLKRVKALQDAGIPMYGLMPDGSPGIAQKISWVVGQMALSRNIEPGSPAMLALEKTAANAVYESIEKELCTLRKQVPLFMGCVSEHPSIPIVSPVANVADIKRSAVSYVERANGDMLAVWNRRYGGWSMPGGLIEPCENHYDAQARELREETGLETVEVYRLYDAPAEPLAANQAAPEHPSQRGRATHVHVFLVLTSGVAEEKEPGAPVTWVKRKDFMRWTPFRSFYEKMFLNHGVNMVLQEFRQKHFPEMP